MSEKVIERKFDVVEPQVVVPMNFFDAHERLRLWQKFAAVIDAFRESNPNSGRDRILDYCIETIIKENLNFQDAEGHTFDPVKYPPSSKTLSNYLKNAGDNVRYSGRNTRTLRFIFCFLRSQNFSDGELKNIFHHQNETSSRFNKKPENFIPKEISSQLNGFSRRLSGRFVCSKLRDVSNNYPSTHDKSRFIRDTVQIIIEFRQDPNSVSSLVAMLCIDDKSKSSENYFDSTRDISNNRISMFFGSVTPFVNTDGSIYHVGTMKCTNRWLPDFNFRIDYQNFLNSYYSTPMGIKDMILISRAEGIRELGVEINDTAYAIPIWQEEDAPIPRDQMHYYQRHGDKAIQSWETRAITGSKNLWKESTNQLSTSMARQLFRHNTARTPREVMEFSIKLNNSRFLEETQKIHHLAITGISPLPTNIFCRQTIISRKWQHLLDNQFMDGYHGS